MSDPHIYDEIDDDPPRPRFRWEYVNCNAVPVPEYVDEEELPAAVEDDDDDIPEGN